LLPVAERKKEVPLASTGKKGFGQANVWYAETSPDFVAEVKQYIAEWNSCV
jgi:hypothetical protein